VWLLNSEWRFPITNFLSIGFPFGEVRFPGVQGALFADVGHAWTAATSDRGTLGSSGLGLRMPIGAPLVLRLDLGYRFHSGAVSGYALPASHHGAKFVDFFFGFNY
jgi:hemolysin activation/secretion protein